MVFFCNVVHYKKCMWVGVTTVQCNKRLLALIPQVTVAGCISSPSLNPSNTHVIPHWCTDLVQGSSSPCCETSGCGVFWVFVPGHVSSSSILSRTNHVVIPQNILLLIRIQEKWCNTVSLVGLFFTQELLFKVSVLLEMLPVKFPIATHSYTRITCSESRNFMQSWGHVLP